MIKRHFTCYECKKVPVRYFKARCVQCAIKSKKRVDSDNRKMLQWHVKEFGVKDVWQMLLASEGIEVIC